MATRKRRSRSADPGDNWLDHRPAGILETDTLFQPEMPARARSITKLVDPKDVTDAKISKYVLTTQEQVVSKTLFKKSRLCIELCFLLPKDSQGEIETKLYKGDVLTTRGGGAQVCIYFCSTSLESC